MIGKNSISSYRRSFRLDIAPKPAIYSGPEKKMVLMIRKIRFVLLGILILSHFLLALEGTGTGTREEAAGTFPPGGESDIRRFLQGDEPAKLKFSGPEAAELFSREIEESFQAVLRKNYKIDSRPFMPGYVTASVDGRPWHQTMWSRDGGTFLRELVMWGCIRHACLTADCLIRLVQKNDEGYYTFPEYFTFIEPASGSEWDGTASIIIALALLWDRLPAEDPYKAKIYSFLHQDSSPLRLIHSRFQKQPLLEGSGEFGGGCFIAGKWINVVQNNLIRLALLAAAKMELGAADHPWADAYRQDAEKVGENMLRFLVDGDGSWIWCIDPGTMKPNPAVINHPINKGFGGMNGVACMTADVCGFEPAASEWKGIGACEKTFAKLYSFPLRREQFKKYGIWTQFDEFRAGMSSGPSYGDGYALQTMLLWDKMEMAEKSITYLARATFRPPAAYSELKRDSPYHFYERYYSPEAVGKLELEQGCGALNLVNVTEPLKAARLLMGVDDVSSAEVKIIIRMPPSWTAIEAENWPIRTVTGVCRANIEYRKKGDKRFFELEVKSGHLIPELAVRFPTRTGNAWIRRTNVR